MFHLRSLLTLSPNILALVTNSRGLPFISTGSKFGGDFEKQILNEETKTHYSKTKTLWSKTKTHSSKTKTHQSKTKFVVF